MVDDKKNISLDILKDDIKKNKIRNLYLFYGPEECLKKIYIETIEKNLLSKEFKALNRIVMEGKQNISAIADNCETLPVFSERKVVIVRNSGLFKTKKVTAKDEMKSQPQNDVLLNFLQDIPGHVCLIFYEAEVDKRLKKIIEAIKKNGLLVEFAYRKPDELAGWVIKKFKENGKEIRMDAASQIVENCEPDMTEISNEIDKLTSYLQERTEVTFQDIEAACTKSIKSRIFDLTDAVAEKNSRKALLLLNSMLIMKEPAPKILFMITRQLRQILQVKLMTGEGSGMGEIASKLGVMPYIAGKILKQAGGFTLDKLKKVLETSFELDLAVKNGRLNDRTAVELLIIEFSN